MNREYLNRQPERSGFFRRLFCLGPKVPRTTLPRNPPMSIPALTRPPQPRDDKPPPPAMSPYTTPAVAPTPVKPSQFREESPNLKQRYVGGSGAGTGGHGVPYGIGGVGVPVAGDNNDNDNCDSVSIGSFGSGDGGSGGGGSGGGGSFGS